MPTLWMRLAAISLPTGLAFCCYWLTAAPGLTWAHHGADGGDLIAAAMVNGVPHPSGYPLYTLLLRGWLALGQLLSQPLGLPNNLAFWGNRLSALFVAGATGFTVAAAAALFRTYAGRWLWAMVAGIAFALTPLAWSQALITEVYGLHALLIAALGWIALTAFNDISDQGTQPRTAIALGLLMGLGAANHLTSFLLWPALLYWHLRHVPPHAWLRVATQIIGLALLLVLLFYGSIVWRMAMAAHPPPIAWGNPHDLAGLWWLVSGAAYRAYVLGMTPLEFAGRLASLARLLVEQFTPGGLALIIGGFAVWDRHRPTLRTGALVWLLPISLYAAGYNTVDSYIYLLPVVWIMSLMLGQGLASGSKWLARNLPQLCAGTTWIPTLIEMLAMLGLIALFIWRLPQVDLRHDRAAQDFLAAAATTLEPHSLVISSADAPTFALWYGAWGSGELAQAVPDLVIVNYALYQFGWYRNLMHDQYPEVPMMGTTFAELIAANHALRPIYLTEPLPGLSSTELTPTGVFWRLNQP